MSVRPSVASCSCSCFGFSLAVPISPTTATPPCPTDSRGHEIALTGRRAVQVEHLLLLIKRLLTESLTSYPPLGLHGPIVPRSGTPRSPSRMPADYHSTARALAVPPSPDEPLSPPLGGIRPPWSRSAGSRRSSAVFSAREVATLRDRIINQTEASWRRISKTFARMTLLQKVGAVSAAIAAIALGLAFMIFTGKIFHWLAPVAESWENSKLAYCILWICIFGVSFPPLVGWSTFGTVSGFIFGIWKGYVFFVYRFWKTYIHAHVPTGGCSTPVPRSLAQPAPLLYRGRFSLGSSND